MVIYADVLICVNIIIDYFLINIVASLLKEKCSFKRRIIGSVSGGVLSLSILIPESCLMVAFLIRIITSSLIVVISFGFSKLKLFFRRLAIFFAASFLFSGSISAINELLSPEGLAVKNGVVYYNISAVLLILFSVISYLLLSLIVRIGRRKSKPTCRISVKDGGNEIHIMALLDSGSSLKEPFSEKWVLLLDSRYSDIIKGAGKSRRIIPFSTVSEDGYLSGFLPDSVSIEGSGEVLDMYVAFSPNSLGSEFGGIISAQAI